VITCKKCFNREDIFISVPSTKYAEESKMSYRFYIMYMNPTFVRDDPKMIALIGRNTGAFRGSELVALDAPFQGFSRTQSPLTPERNYGVPWFMTIPAGKGYAEFMTIDSDGLGFGLWTLTSGELGPYKTNDYTPIVPDGIYNGLVTYQASVMLQDDFNVMYMCYQLGGHSDDWATTTRPTHFKVVSYNSIGSQKETLSNSIPIVVKRYGIMPGTFFRKFNIKDKVLDSYTRQLFMYNQPAEAVGTLYEVTTAPNTGSALFTAVLRSAGSSSITTNRHINYYTDIFSAPESLYWYIINVCADVSYYPQGLSYGVNIGYYPSTSLSVEKRRKADWSLVKTYNLTPTACDRELQGLSVAAQVYNSDSGTAFSHPSPESLTRLLPVCVDTSLVTATGVVSGTTPEMAGAVLIDEDGNEYPFLAVNVITQDRFFTTEAERTAYISSPTVGSTGWGTLCQSSMLWLGGTGVGKTWPGVDAIGLQITKFPSNITSRKNIGQFNTFYRGLIADKSILYHQLKSYDIYGTDLNFYTDQYDSTNLDGMHYANQPSIVHFENTSTIAGDTFVMELSNGVDTSQDIVLTQTSTGNILNSDLAALFLSQIIAAGYTATRSDNIITIQPTTSGYLVVDCTASRPSWEKTRKDYFVTVSVSRNIDTVTTDVIMAVSNIQHKVRPCFLHELEIQGDDDGT